MTRRSAGSVAVLAALALAVTGCTTTDATSNEPARTVEVAHAQGTAVVPADPGRVVVLDYALLDTLAALELDDRVVGTPKATLPPTLAEYADVTDVGTLAEPDLEAIAELDPDLIVAGGRSAPRYAELAAIAPTLDLTHDTARPVESLAERSTALASVFGAEQQVQRHLDELDAAIAEARALTDPTTTGLILLTSGGKLSAFGPGGRFGALIHDVVGVPPASRDLVADTHGQAVSFEFVAQVDPGVLFVVDRDSAIGQEGASARQVLDNPLVAGTTAWSTDRVTYLDGTNWYLLGSGLTTTRAMVDEIRKALSGS